MDQDDNKFSYTIKEYRYQDKRPNHSETKKMVFKKNMLFVLEENKSFVNIFDPSTIVCKHKIICNSRNHLFSSVILDFDFNEYDKVLVAVSQDSSISKWLAEDKFSSEVSCVSSSG